MAETPSKIESMRKWVVDHKLRAVGCLWLTGITSSVAYNWSRPNMKTSVKLIHARYAFANIMDDSTTTFPVDMRCPIPSEERMVHFKVHRSFLMLHAQALTLAALVGSGLVEYHDQKYGSSGPKVDRYTRQYIAHSHKD